MKTQKHNIMKGNTQLESLLALSMVEKKCQALVPTLYTVPAKIEKTQALVKRSRFI